MNALWLHNLYQIRSWIPSLLQGGAFLALSLSFLSLTSTPPSPTILLLLYVMTFLIAFPSPFADDLKDGSLQRFFLNKVPLSSYVVVKLTLQTLCICCINLIGFGFASLFLEIPLLSLFTVIALTTPGLMFLQGCLSLIAAHTPYLSFVLSFPLQIPALLLSHTYISQSTEIFESVPQLLLAFSLTSVVGNCVCLCILLKGFLQKS